MRDYHQHFEGGTAVLDPELEEQEARRAETRAKLNEPNLTEKANFYARLGLEVGASGDDIRTAYRDIAKKYHPDQNPGDKVAEEKFRLAAEAYDTLSDTLKRIDYIQFTLAPEYAARSGSPQDKGGPRAGEDAFRGNFDDAWQNAAFRTEAAGVGAQTRGYSVREHEQAQQEWDEFKKREDYLRILRDPKKKAELEKAQHKFRHAETVGEVTMEVAGKLKNVPIIIATARDGWFSGKKYHLIDPETKIPFPLPARQQGYDSMEVNDEGQLVGHYTETHEDEQGHTYSVKKVAILDVRTGDDLNRNPGDLNARKAGSGRMHDNLRDARGTDLRQRR